MSTTPSTSLLGGNVGSSSAGVSKSQKRGLHTQEWDEDWNYEQKAEKRKRCYVSSFLFLLGIAIGVGCVFLAIAIKRDAGGNNGSSWSASDYQSNFEYYWKQKNLNFTVHDNVRLDRLSQPMVSPDGLTLVFVRTQYQMPDSKQSASTLWFMRWPFTAEAPLLPLTQPIWGVHDSQPCWGPEARTILFLSNRASSGLQQIFQLQVPLASDVPSSTTTEPVTFMGSLWSQLLQTAPAGKHSSHSTFHGQVQSATATPPIDTSGDPDSYVIPTAAASTFVSLSQLTDFPLDVDNLDLDPTGSIIAFSAQVYANMTMQQTADYLQQKQQNGGNFELYDKLFVRHWDRWNDHRWNHPMLLYVQQDSNARFQIVKGFEIIDLLQGVPSDSPTRPEGGREEWSFSSSGSQFAFTRQHDETSAVAWNTNLDVFVVKITVPNEKQKVFSVTTPRCLTCDNLATDTQPAFSPTEENTLAYISSTVPGYESDRMQVKLIRNGQLFNFTQHLDITFTSVDWSGDGNSLFLGALVNARNSVYQFDAKKFNYTMIAALQNGTNGEISVDFVELDFFIYSSSSYMSPNNIYLYSLVNKTSIPLATPFNAVALQSFTLSQPVDLSFNGANNDRIQMWYFPPAGLDTTRKYPVAFLVHGGPQVPWTDAWSYRWNPQLWAAKGYAVVMINFHGSAGWGQNFTDSIRADYGNKPMIDLFTGLQFVLSQYSYLDGTRVAALGASYGGYMINWLAGHNQNNTFAVFVCHDGMFDIRHFYYGTEELWFPEHDTCQNNTDPECVPWKQPEAFEKWNPVNFVNEWHTPQMIIHGGIDYRIDVTHGIGAFTALQRKGIDSQMLYFPNENHWVLNARDSIQWYETVLQWIGKHTNNL